MELPTESDSTNDFKMKKASVFIGLLFVYLQGFSQADTTLIKEHFDKIVKTEKYRNYRNVQTLDTIASYIKAQFENYADTTYYQKYTVDNNEYKNVISVFGKHLKKTIVIGAHYDVCGDQDGADDNASGVIGLLELARLLKGKSLNHRIELVGYTLEEPPFFRTKNMGSYRHAKSLFDFKRDVLGMLSFDMIGYFDEAKNSQKFPIGIMSCLFGTKGDYIMLVNKWGKGKFARRLKRKLTSQNIIKAKSLSGPKSIEGLDWSDHLNYWKFGYSASMLTDTGPNRNKNYHQKSDIIDTIDIPKMAKVIDAVLEVILKID